VYPRPELLLFLYLYFENTIFAHLSPFALIWH
jgi:hypothetical protein